MTQRVLSVTAAVMVRQGRILLARRADNGHLHGKWEFPGGKVEPGESPEKCLARELDEEFGIAVVIGELIMRRLHRYPNGAVRLIVFRVTQIAGRFRPVDHDRIVWVPPERLLSYDLAPADIPVARLVMERMIG